MASLKAKQLAASGLVTGQRALFKQLVIFHAGAHDIEIKFYDRTVAPVGGEPYYSFLVYGKGVNNLPIVEPGVLFDDGIYMVAADDDAIVTVIYEEV